MAQRSWTIEVRADFTDPGKNSSIDHAVKQKAVELFSMLQLLSDGQAPNIACWSEDFFHGKTDLNIFAKEHVDTEAIKATAETLDDVPVSDELMAAAAEILHDKNNNR